MALWAIMASPLMVSSDVRRMRAASRRILLNPYVIAINQDVLGKQAVIVKTVIMIIMYDAYSGGEIYW